MSYLDQLDQFPVKTVSIDGEVQAYREAGTGEQYLVLLHGISSGSGSWVIQLENLVSSFHVIAWDAPGYGQSEVLKISQPNARDYATRLKGLFDALNIDKAIVVGHSLGAFQASAFASQYPEQVLSLVLANAAQGYGNDSPEKQLEVFQKRPKMLQELGAEGMAERRGPHLIYQQKPEALDLLKNMMGNIQLEGFRHASYLLAYDAIQQYLTQLVVETYAIAGNQDGITSLDSIQKLVNEFPSIHFYQINDAGHLSYIDQSEQFNQIILTIASKSK